jgi:hypothetical protein
MPSPKSGQIVVGWATEKHSDPGLVYCRLGDRLMSRDTNMLGNFFETQLGLHGRTLIEELKERGYDLSTFRFSIQKLPLDQTAVKPNDGGSEPTDPFYRLPQ